MRNDITWFISNRFIVLNGKFVFAPFRRQLRRADIKELNLDYHTIIMKVWLSFNKDRNLSFNLKDLGKRIHHALMAAILPYRLPGNIRKWVLSKPESYFIKIGHGCTASPEIYSGGPGYLLT